MFGKSLNKARRGFTLIEIMIVVLIIGILLAIAVPNFVKARESSRTKACIGNLKQIDSAKEQWAMDTKQAANAAVADLSVIAEYIKGTPTCPSNDADYVPGNIGVNPTCPNGGEHVLPL